MQVSYKKGCIPWDKSTEDIFSNQKCLKLPSSLILDELVLHSVDDGNCINEKKETGYLIVNFEIVVSEKV